MRVPVPAREREHVALRVQRIGSTAEVAAARDPWAFPRPGSPPSKSASPALAGDAHVRPTQFGCGPEGSRPLPRLSVLARTRDRGNSRTSCSTPPQGIALAQRISDLPPHCSARRRSAGVWKRSIRDASNANRSQRSRQRRRLARQQRSARSYCPPLPVRGQVGRSTARPGTRRRAPARGRRHPRRGGPAALRPRSRRHERGQDAGMDRRRRCAAPPCSTASRVISAEAQRAGIADEYCGRHEFVERVRARAAHASRGARRPGCDERRPTCTASRAASDIARPERVPASRAAADRAGARPHHLVTKNGCPGQPEQLPGSELLSRASSATACSDRGRRSPGGLCAGWQIAEHDPQRVASAPAASR